MRLILSIDVEATGKSVTEHDCPCFGAALVDADEVAVVSTFFTHVNAGHPLRWEERCVTEFWDKPANIAWKEEIVAANPTAPDKKEAIAAFRAWLAEKTAGHKVLFLGLDTCAYDGSWMDHLMGDDSCSYLLGKYRTVRDMSSFYAGVGLMSPTEALNGTEAAACKRLKVTLPEWEEYPHDHHPDNDAANIALTAAFLCKHVVAAAAALQ